MSISHLARCGVVIIALFILLMGLPAQALETTAKQAILIDNVTGTVLFEKDADELMEPSSMSKIMTIYMIFDRKRRNTTQIHLIYDLLIFH